MSDRDLFRDFDRMRREMDELFGDVLDRRMGRRGSGFSPAVDVYYCGDPPKAVVVADLAGVDPAGVTLEIRGRELVIAGNRSAPEEDRACPEAGTPAGRRRTRSSRPAPPSPRRTRGPRPGWARGALSSWSKT